MSPIPVPPGKEKASALDRVVVQFGGRTLKGYTDRSAWPAEGDLAALTLSPPIRLPDSVGSEPVPLDGAKAIFFVKSFAGKWHDDLRFHDHLSPQECLWVRATFRDGEVIEGLIRNSGHFVTCAGFYMFPVDPEGNNLLIYVLKNKLSDFQVLGLRPAPANLLGLGPERTPS